MLRIIGDTIELDNRPVAMITAPEGTLRELFEHLLEQANRDIDDELNGARSDGYAEGHKHGVEQGYETGYDAGRRDATRERAT
jgi:flagellar biosynthesis/type III secretory pathway protein FliH